MEVPKVIKDYFLKLYFLYGVNPIPPNNLRGCRDNELLPISPNHDWNDNNNPLNVLSIYSELFSFHWQMDTKSFSTDVIDFLMSDSNFYEREHDSKEN